MDGGALPVTGVLGVTSPFDASPAAVTACKCEKIIIRVHIND